MIQLLRFNLIATNNARIGFSGQYVHGFFFRSLSLTDPRIARIVHDVQTKKAYCVTPVLEEPSDGRWWVAETTRSGRDYFFQIGTLEEKLAAVNLRSLLKTEPEVTVGAAKFVIRDIAVETKSYQELLRLTRPTDRFRVDFVTPTHFKVFDSTFHHLLPSPMELMDDLLRSWNEFAPRGCRFQWRVGNKRTALPYREWVRRSIGIVRHWGLKTVKPVTQHQLPGFIGHCLYKVEHQRRFRKDRHERMAKVTDALLRFARFSNVGGGRTLGLGVVRIPEPVPT